MNLCTLESDPTKALPKDSSLSSYPLHILHLSPPQLLLPPRENFPYPAYYALHDELRLKPKEVQMNKITYSAFFLKQYSFTKANKTEVAIIEHHKGTGIYNHQDNRAPYNHSRKTL